MNKLVPMVLLCVMANGASAQAKRFDLPEDVVALVTLMVFEDGPGARVAVIWPAAPSDADLYLPLAVSSLREFLAEERWCMDGFTLGEPVGLADRGFEVEARCK